jgi:hypothetical protein
LGKPVPERPEQLRGTSGGRWPIALVAVVVLLLVVSACAGSESDTNASGTVTTEAAFATTTVPPPGLPAVPRITMFGDSTALMTSWGLLAELDRTRRAEFVEGFTGLGCSVLRTTERRIADDVELTDPTCNGWADVWKGEIETSRPDVVVVQTGSWDVADRRLAGDDQWRSPGDPVFDAFALSEMLAAVDLLSSTGAAVVWLTSPVPGAVAYKSARVQAFDPAPRHQRFDELVRQLPGLRPGKVVDVDLAGWMADQTLEEDARLRPDGIHFSHDASTEVCRRYLCDAVLRAAAQLKPGPPPGSTPPTTAAITAVAGPAAPDGRDQAAAQLLGRPLYDAGLAASIAGWRVRVDADGTFDASPNADDELVLWWWTGVVNDVR